MDSSKNLFIDYGSETGTDTIKISNQENINYAIESFEIKNSSGETQLLTSDDINKLVQDMTAYATDNGISINSVADVKGNQDLMNLVINSWAA